MKQLNYLILQILFLAGTVFTSSCQSSNSFPGVYAGVKLSLNPLGGAMNRTDVVILLRKDKTFTDQLEKPDWKTAVRGKYEIKGADLHLLYANGDKDEYIITKSGNLDAGTFTLFKMELDNSVPKGSYQFKFVSGAGGIATGSTYVGSSSRRELNFDWAGNFSTDRQSTTVIAGDNIGGGTNTKSDGKGKYVVKDGTLTLKYDNGTTTTHSFFASAASGKNKAMAVIDGSFYFMGEAGDEKKSSASTAANGTNAKLPTASQLLTELRKKYGGVGLDGIKTYVVKAEFNGIKLISYNDLTGKRFRNEMYQQGKLIAVEQMGPSGGWLWNNGKKTTASSERLQEVKYNDYVGVIGLSNKYNSAFSKGTVQATKSGYAVGFQLDGHTFVYVIDKDYNIIGDSYEIGNSKQANSYSNNRTINGITMPFTTVSSSGKNKITLNYQSIEVNKPLSTTWQLPGN